MNFDLITPETTEELLQAIDENQRNNFRFGAGYTDLILELGAQPDEELTVINLAKLGDGWRRSREEQVPGESYEHGKRIRSF